MQATRASSCSRQGSRTRAGQPLPNPHAGWRTSAHRVTGPTNVRRRPRSISAQRRCRAARSSADRAASTRWSGRVAIAPIMTVGLRRAIPGWDFASVLPFFRQSETWEDGASEFRGDSGPVRVERVKDPHPAIAALIEAGRSFGMPYLDDHNVPEPEGRGAGKSDDSRGQAVQHGRRLPASRDGSEESLRSDGREGAEAHLFRDALHGARVCHARWPSHGERCARSRPLRRGHRHAAPAYAFRRRAEGRAGAARPFRGGRSAGRWAEPAGPRHDLRSMLRGEGAVAARAAQPERKHRAVEKPGRPGPPGHQFRRHAVRLRHAGARAPLPGPRRQTASRCCPA